MFWNKKKKADDIILEDPQAESGQRREAFRYLFKRKERPIMIFKKTKVLIINISAGGVAFYSNRTFRQYEEDMIHMNLKVPGQYEGGRLSVKVRILGVTREGVCNCIFENCTIDQYEQIHQYVFELQKRDLRRQKRG